MSAGSTTQNRLGKNAKHANHTVPKALLKRWLTTVNGQEGLWYLDCATGAIRFELGKKASFAISEYRYVPVRASAEGAIYRDESIEDWFSTGESDLARITDLVLQGQSLQGLDASGGGFLQAAILLGFRSSYEYQLLEDALIASDPDMSMDAVARRVLDQFRKTYSLKLREFSNWDYQIVRTPDVPLLVCDRPMFDMTLHEQRLEILTIPLAPTLLMFATPPKDRDSKHLTLTISTKLDENLARLSNISTAERARGFVVGRLDQLQAIQPEFLGNKFENRRATDRIVVETKPAQSKP